MTQRRRPATRPATRRAVVAACWSFPIHSQTFVYQEIQCLQWAGLDPLMFCCQTNSRDELPAAFSELWDKKVVLVAEWDRNQQDFQHFQDTRPGRVDSLLSLLEEETGRERAALLAESIVMMGFTFARHVELAGAEYIHTYFFYDQSFMAFMAAHLLGLPRGVTAYADHMLNDYTFKCVPLHLRTANVIVATSQRIRQELERLAGEGSRPNILVKPNGIDTERFAFVSPGERLVRAPEIIAVNRLEPKKGLLSLIEAVHILRERGHAPRLHIVGGVDAHTPTSAEYGVALRQKIESFHLEDSIVMHGIKRQADILPLLRQSRVFVAPYVEVSSGDKDGIPTAVLEAMSTGLPIVATDAGSIPEVVRSGVDGLCVAQGHPVALADAIEQLLLDHALFARMSVAARERVTSTFDIRVTESHLHEHIRHALES